MTLSAQLARAARTASLTLWMTFACCLDAYAATPGATVAITRDVLVDRVAAARKSQDDARNAYFNALQQLRAIAIFDGTNLAPMSDRLSSRLEEAKARARDFDSRVDAIEAAADALSHDRNDEITQQRTTSRLAQKSRLALAHARYASMRDALRGTRASLTAALAALNDKAQYLEHNLGADAIGTIKSGLPHTQKDADRLHRDAEQSSAAVERFVREFSAQP